MEVQEIKELINRRRRQILVHSYIYYQLNDNIIEDNIYDKWSKELIELQNNYPELAATIPYHEEFKEFDGSTGFDLPKDNWTISIALKILRYKDKYLHN